MKRVLFLAGVVLGTLLSTNGFAEKPKQSVSDAVHEQNCLDISELASAIMEARQKGASLVGMMSVANKEEDTLKRTIAKEIVADAFKVPKYSSETIQQEEANEFSAKYYLGCMEMYN